MHNQNNHRTEAADGGKTAFATLTNLTVGAQNKYYGRLRFFLDSAPGTLFVKAASDSS